MLAKRFLITVWLCLVAAAVLPAQSATPLIQFEVIQFKGSRMAMKIVQKN